MKYLIMEIKHLAKLMVIPLVPVHLSKHLLLQHRKIPMFPPRSREFSVYLRFCMQYGFWQNNPGGVQSEKNGFCILIYKHFIALISSTDMSQQIHHYGLPHNVFSNLKVKILGERNFQWSLQKNAQHWGWAPNMITLLITWQKYSQAVCVWAMSKPFDLFRSHMAGMAFVQVLSHSDTTSDDCMLLCLHMWKCIVSCPEEAGISALPQHCFSSDGRLRNSISSCLWLLVPTSNVTVCPPSCCANTVQYNMKQEGKN